MNNENRTPDYDFSKLTEPFKALISSPEQMFQFLDMFPMPMEVFTPDGTTAFLNRAMIDMFGMVNPDAETGVGKFNILNDPVSDEVFGHEVIERAFRGEAVSVSEFRAPIQDLVDRGLTQEKPFEAAYLDVYMLPLWNDDRLAFVTAIFTQKRMYQGIPRSGGGERIYRRQLARRI